MTVNDCGPGRQVEGADAAHRRPFGDETDMVDCGIRCIGVGISHLDASLKHGHRPLGSSGIQSDEHFIAGLCVVGSRPRKGLPATSPEGCRRCRRTKKAIGIIRFQKSHPNPRPVGSGHVDCRGQLIDKATLRRERQGNSAVYPSGVPVQIDDVATRPGATAGS